MAPTLTVRKPKESFNTFFALLIRNVWLAMAPSIHIVTSNIVRSLYATVAAYRNWNERWLLYWGIKHKSTYDVFWKCWQIKLTLTVGKPNESFNTLFTVGIRNVWLAGAPSIRIVTFNRSLYVTLASCKSKWKMIFVLSSELW